MSRIVPASLAQMTDLIAEAETMDGFDLYTVLLNTPGSCLVPELARPIRHWRVLFFSVKNCSNID
jgi:hypothetical protein